jgi:thiamine-phosphate pyrophosphorylase
VSFPYALIFIPDPAFGRVADRADMARRALDGGATAIQLRAKDLPVRELVAEGERLAALCRRRSCPFFVNDRVDVALACGADGVHLGRDDMDPRTARRLLGADALIGVSVHDQADVESAEAVGAAYGAVGAVYSTSTKTIDVVGTEGVRRLRAMTSLPVVAVGGVDAARAPEAVAAGADGVAVISALSAAEDIEGAARELRRRVDAARSDRVT